MNTQDYFSFLGFEPKLQLDGAALQRRFYEMSRQWHPDRFATKGVVALAEAEEKTALLNDAFRTLKDPVQRAEYVLKQHGFDIGEQRSNNVPPELLEEVFELNMALDELKTGDASVKPQLEFSLTQFTSMLSSNDSELSGLFAAWDEGQNRESLQKIRNVLNRRKYIQNLVKTVNQALTN